MVEGRSTAPRLEALTRRARALTDADRLALAEARAAVDETFHVGAWKAANEIAVERAGDYMTAWMRLGPVFIPERLDALVQQGAASDPDELARWQEVARLTRIAIDDVLLAEVAADLMRPPDLRELYRPWQAMLAAAASREPAEPPR